MVEAKRAEDNAKKVENIGKPAKADDQDEIAFEKSFYGKGSVKAIHDDQYKLRIKMLESCGSNMKPGMNQKMNVFWKSSSKAYSKPFLKENPDFLQ